MTVRRAGCTKGGLYTFAVGCPLDYQAKDFYELLKFYQRPRFEAWLRAMGERWDGKPPQLLETYKAIEQPLVKLDVASLEPPSTNRTALDYVKDEWPTALEFHKANR